MTVKHRSTPSPNVRSMRLAAGPVDVNLIAGARVAGGNRERLPVDGEGDVADEAFVEDRVDSLGLEGSPGGQAPQARALRWCQRQVHGPTIAGEWTQS